MQPCAASLGCRTLTMYIASLTSGWSHTKARNVLMLPSRLSPASPPPRRTCAARILDCVADLRCHRRYDAVMIGFLVLLKIVYLLVRQLLSLAVLVFRGEPGE